MVERCAGFDDLMFSGSLTMSLPKSRYEDVMRWVKSHEPIEAFGEQWVVSRVDCDSRNPFITVACIRVVVTPPTIDGELANTPLQLLNEMDRK